MAAPFPPRLRSEDVAGVDVVMLDADVAGCVTTWLHGGHQLDHGRRQELEGSVREAARVLGELTDAVEIAYVARLRALALAVVRS